ncbi:MAG: helix-turn-helix domain-containing protein [Mangrovicoccus sp.]
MKHFNDLDWAAECRDYRLVHGLKQEAMAQDFHVDQSTVSLWERGLREPPMHVKQTILNARLDAGQAKPDQAMQLLLEHSGSAVAVWDRSGHLRGCSARFAAELINGGASEPLENQSARDLLAGHDIVERALQILERSGFFEGQVALAVFSFPPFFQDRRRQAGGMITASTLPLQLMGGEIAMMSIYDHDALAETKPILTVSWTLAEDGHCGVESQPFEG